MLPIFPEELNLTATTQRNATPGGGNTYPNYHVARHDAAGKRDAALGDDGPDDATGQGAPRGTTPRAGAMLRWATTAPMTRRPRCRDGQGTTPRQA